MHHTQNNNDQLRCLAAKTFDATFGHLCITTGAFVLPEVRYDTSSCAGEQL